MTENSVQFFLDYSMWIIGLNIILMFAIKPIVAIFKKEGQQGSIFKFRLINVGFIILLSLGSLFEKHEGTFISMFLTLFALYMAVLSYEGIAYIIVKRSGTKVKIQGKPTIVDNHNTRIMSLLSLVFLTFVTLVILIKIWGFDSSLEATGIVGIFVGALAFTHQIWLPDLWAGILLLNNKFINDGDTIGYKDKRFLVYKFGFFGTILLNIEGENDREFIKNSQLRDTLIPNFDKPASAAGIRQPQYYTIGYRNDESYEAYFKKLEDAVEKIQESFHKVYHTSENDGIVNIKAPLDFNIVKLGDNGIDIVLAYYLNDIGSYKSTGKLREIFSKTKSNFHKAVIIELQKKGIYVDTPTLFSKVEDFREAVLPKPIKAPADKKGN